MDQQLRGYVAETIGVFLVVFLGGAAVCASLLPDASQPRVNLWAIALAEGLSLAAVLPIVFRESPGCLNPAITLTFWVCKRLDGRQTLLLIASQLVGSLLAGLAIFAIFPEGAVRLVTPHIQEALTEKGQASLATTVPLAALVEAVLTFVMTFAVFGLMIDRRSTPFGGVFVGLVRVAVVIAGYNLTGASANPARWFGPYVWQFTLTQVRRDTLFWDHAPFWVGPVVGALAAGLVYTTFLLPPDQAKEAGR
jgi:glycerol uptake facilitator-like aquaporin